MNEVLEIVHRFGADLIERTRGPMSFRFFLQPAMALAFALRDGLRDAKGDAIPYFRSVFRGSRVTRRQALREGVATTGRILLLGIIMDAIYQYRVLREFYPVEAVVIVILLGFMPYLLLRGPVLRIARRWRRRDTPGP